MCVSYGFIKFVFVFFSSTPKSSPSFEKPVLSDSVPINMYIQGSPMYTSNEQYFTIPQVGCLYAVSSTAFLE